MAFAIGHISGCHLNPAISVGLVVGKRFSASDLPAYVIAQVAGAIAAAGVLYVIASGKAGFSLSGGLLPTDMGNILPAAIRCWPAWSPRLCSLCFFFSSSWVPLTNGPCRLRAYRDWPVPDPHPPDRNSGHQSFRKSRPQHRAGCICRRLGAGPALALLGRSDYWRSLGWWHLPRCVW